MKHSPIIILLSLLLLGLMGLTACNQRQTLTSPGTAVLQRSPTQAMDYSSLVNRLHTAGATLVAGGEVRQPFMSVAGRIIKVNGERVEVYEYANAADANKQASRISSDGCSFTIVSPSGTPISTTEMVWTSPPHFYKSGRVIVIYVGLTGNVMQLLTGVLGTQFAGM